MLGGIIILETFKRLEKKYIISKQQYNQLLNIISDYIEKDKYFKSKINNIYFDTNDFELVRASIDKPIYKEKVRLRSYGIPNDNDNVFFEIKKKYKGITNKRRIIVTNKEINYYFKNNIIPNDCNKQILNEIDYCMKFYNLEPKVFLAYDRNSWLAKENNNFRLTFDKNIRFRLNNLNLNNSSGEKILDDNLYIMEIKTLDSIPLWFVKTLSDLKIYPTSFSKYGNVYINYILKESDLC